MGNTQVREGQIWADRELARNNGRSFVVTQVGRTHATAYTVTGTGRLTRISLSRLKGNAADGSRKYQLVYDPSFGIVA
jgi:hypothetical protein